MILTLKIFESNGSTLKTDFYSNGVISDYEDFKVSLNRFGGFGGSSLSIKEWKNTAFKFAPGDVIKGYFPDGSLVCTYIVDTISRNLANRAQDYVLKTKWDLLSQVNFNADSFGSQGNQTTITTVAQLVSYIYTTYISPLGVGVNWNSAKISASATIERLKLSSDTSIYDFLQTLLIIASSDGNNYSCGIDETGDLFFLPTPTTLVATVDVNANCDNAVEYFQQGKIINSVSIVGSPIKENGYTLNRKYIASNASTYGKTNIRRILVPQIAREADAVKFSTGIFTRYSAPSISIQDLEFFLVPGSTPYIPKPWSGQIRYMDSERAVDQTNYLNSVDVSFSNTINYTAQIGLATISQFDSVFGDTSDYLDKYSPDVLDSTNYQKEYLPEANETGLINSTIDGNEPHLTNGDIGSIPADLQTHLDNIDSDISTLQSDQTANDTDISNLQSDMTGVKSDVATAKSDIATAKSDIATAKSDISALQSQTGIPQWSFVANES